MLLDAATQDEYGGLAKLDGSHEGDGAGQLDLQQGPGVGRDRVLLDGVRALALR